MLTKDSFAGATVMVKEGGFIYFSIIRAISE
jgi:hypothetical protein